METHPIPQQISSYQFRLVGDMTLKQFFQVAGGALISLIFYASKLPFWIKWPFIIFFSLLGAALAFVPFEDRPLEKWIFSFFKSVYSPTKFYWNKIRKEPIFFQEQAPVPQDKIIAPKGESQLKKYLSNILPVSPIAQKLDSAEQSFLNSMGVLFTAGSANTGTTTIQTQTPQQKGEIKIPQSKPLSYAKKTVVTKQPAVKKETNLAGQVSATFKTQELKTRAGVQFSVDAAPPSPPTVPNTIVGQVLDTNGKIIEGAILEVKDVSGRPVRALKSNKLGHFLVVTPLQNGKYEISTEKDGFSFEPKVFQAEGKIIPAIAVKGKSQIIPVIKEEKTNA